MELNLDRKITLKSQQEGYTVPKAEADAFVAKMAKDRPHWRLMVMERRSQGGWGVWHLDEDHWVYVR